MRFLAVLLICVVLSGCYVGKGVVHTVGRGETLWRICHTYGVEMEDVASLNGIEDPSEIRTGKKLFIPGVDRVRNVVPYGGEYSGEVVKASVDRPERVEPEPVDITREFKWPVEGSVTSRFGMRDGIRHDGIDIVTRDGSPIKAADDGTVIFVSENMRGYGRIIIIKHPDDFYTVYAHNSSNGVRKGERVKKGEVIGEVGSSGNATTSHLHFEVRKGKKVIDPLFCLP